MELAIVASGVVEAVVVLPDDAVPDGSGYGIVAHGAVHEEVNVSSISPLPGVGWTYDGENFIAPADARTLEQRAAAAALAGLTISLSGTLTLAATLFLTDPETQRKLGNVGAAIGATGEFPGGVTSLPMRDASGAWHSLTLSQWKAVAGAISAYVAACDLIADGNPLGATELPLSSTALVV